LKITDEVLAKIEIAFGFKLYEWQMEYIKGNTNRRAGGRRNGNTFAYCVRMLLQDDNKIKLSELRTSRYLDGRHGTQYIGWFRRYLLDINEVLVNNGFETNFIDDRSGRK